jgi:hypothetical protein
MCSNLLNFNLPQYAHLTCCVMFVEISTIFLLLREFAKYRQNAKAFKLFTILNLFFYIPVRVYWLLIKTVIPLLKMDLPIEIELYTTQLIGCFAGKMFLD